MDPRIVESRGPILSVATPRRFENPSNRYPIVKMRFALTFCASHVITCDPSLLLLLCELGSHSSLYWPSSISMGYSAGHPNKMDPVMYTYMHDVTVMMPIFVLSESIFFLLNKDVSVNLTNKNVKLNQLNALRGPYNFAKASIQALKGAKEESWRMCFVVWEYS